MGTMTFQGYVFDAAGAAIVGATVHIYDRNTVTPAREDAPVATGATGLWTATRTFDNDGTDLYDVEIIYGTTKIRRKYDDQIQIDTIEVANLYLRNPADTYRYNIVPGAITADRAMSMPLIAQDVTLGPVMAARNAVGDSTTSTNAQTTIITLSSLAIPIGSHVIVEAALRKSTGHASAAFIGLKLNATQVLNDVQFTSATNAAESGHFRAEFTMGVTNFLRSGVIRVGTYQQAYAMTPFDADMPAATLTDVILTGHVTNALNTLAINYIRVYYEP